MAIIASSFMDGKDAGFIGHPLLGPLAQLDKATSANSSDIFRVACMIFFNENKKRTYLPLTSRNDKYSVPS